MMITLIKSAGGEAFVVTRMNLPAVIPTNASPLHCGNFSKNQTNTLNDRGILFYLCGLQGGMDRLYLSVFNLMLQGISNKSSCPLSPTGGGEGGGTLS